MLFYGMYSHKPCARSYKLGREGGGAVHSNLEVCTN